MKNISQSLIILILFLIQFIDVLDFMVVMPLGPDLAMSMKIDETRLGYLASSYALAAALAGILTSTFIDRFERKKLLIFTLVGLAAANIYSAYSTSFIEIVMSRFVAGLFGGPMTSLCFAVVADLFSEKERGKVMGKVMSGFSLAAVLGVPLGLKVAEYYTWHASFYMVAVLTFFTIILIIFFMPTLSGHLKAVKVNKVSYISLFSNKVHLMAFVAACFGSVASFMIIPYISPFIQFNMNFPRCDISYIYSVGGILSFFAMRYAGKLVDKKYSHLTLWMSNFFIMFTFIFGFIFTVKFIPVIIIFVPFMIGMAIRNVASFTIYSKIPVESERAGFMSVISCVQHFSSSLGGILTSMILFKNANEKLENMISVTIISTILFIMVPLILKNIQSKLKEAQP